MILNTIYIQLYKTKNPRRIVLGTLNPSKVDRTGFEPVTKEL